MSKVKLGINDIKTKYPDLVKEWDYELNKDVDPCTISAHSHKKYYWICKNGHSYSATVSNRTAGHECPYCAHKKPIKGVNDLETIYPLIAKEWDIDANKGIQPSEVMPHSSKKYMWKCEKGHSYSASINNRTNGYGCPYCSKRLPIKGINDLETLFPSSINEWDYELNYPVTPDKVSAKSNKKYLWKCEKGHSYLAQPYARLQGNGCPYCSGHQVLKGFNDLATINPTLASEWNYKKNGKLSPTDVTKSSSKKVWWVCEKGHEWQSTISHRNNNLGCPYCSGRYPIVGETDLQTVNPVLAKEWHPTKNGDLTPQMVLPNSDKRVYWLCPICKYEWQDKISNRNSRNSGCPKCRKRNKTSFPEQAIFYYVKQVFPDALNSYKDIFQNQMELDIYIPSKKIGIEYDGNYHKGQKRDAAKYDVCKENRIHLIRISEIPRDDIANLCDTFIVSKHLRSTDGGLDQTIHELFSLLKVSNISINVSRDKNDIYNQYLTRLKENSLADSFPLIAKEWHPSKNGMLRPETFNWGSGEKVWWKCQKCGNEWQATIASRTSNNVGCPLCARKKTKHAQLQHHLDNGKNTLIAKYPSIAKEWNYARNMKYDILQITPSSNEKVWWICKKGHEWKTTVNSRTSGTKCPYCSGKKVILGQTDLASKNPSLAKIWNYKMNSISPTEITEKSNKKVWWVCDKGHEWQASVSSMSRRNKCPYCSGHRVLKGFNDLETLRPDLMKEWDYDENIDINPSEVTEHSGKKAWWTCQKCGYKWYSVIDSRSKGHGCPSCARERNKKNKKF